MSLIKKICGEVLKSKKARIVAELKAVTPVLTGRLKSTVTAIPNKGKYENGIAFTLGRKGDVKKNNINSGTDVKTKIGKTGYENIRVEKKYNLTKNFLNIVKKSL